ncbi:MAG: hypothetical protein U0586_07575 [Candidatus Brocadiaceae bacterium]
MTRKILCVSGAYRPNAGNGTERLLATDGGNKTNLAKEYMEMVIEHGVACCELTCKNPHSSNMQWMFYLPLVL